MRRAQQVKATLFAMLLLSALAPLATAAETDPLEGFNRKIDAFNQFGDRWLIRPAAVTYRTLMPEVVDQGVTNMFNNVREPITIVNDLLQFKFKKAGADTGRLLLNSTVGLLGFFDVAAKAGLPRQVEDFGQTLGYWGVPAGPYVVIPLLGPSNLRDAFGQIPDAFANPIAYIDDDLPRFSALSLYYVDLRADIIDVEGLISGDQYVFVRDAYLQDREYLVKDGAVVDDFGDEDF